MFAYRRPAITVEDIQKQAQDILGSVYMRMLVAGNVYKDEAIRMAEIAEEGLGATELKSTELDDQALALPESEFCCTPALTPLSDYLI